MTIVAAQTTAAPSTQTRTTLPRRLRRVVFVVGVSVSLNFSSLSCVSRELRLSGQQQNRHLRNRNELSVAGRCDSGGYSATDLWGSRPVQAVGRRSNGVGWLSGKRESPGLDAAATQRRGANQRPSSGLASDRSSGVRWSSRRTLDIPAAGR